MEIINLILSLSVGINAVLAFGIYYHDPKSNANKFYAIAVASAALWVFSMLMFRLLPIESDYFLFWTRSLYFFASFIALGFLYFSLEFSKIFFFSDDSHRRKILIVKYILLAIAIFIIISIFFPQFITDISHKDSLKVVSFGSLYIFYILYITFYFFSAFFILFNKYRSSIGIERIQIVYIFLGVLFPTIIGIIFDLILPLKGSFRYYWLGPAAVPIMSIFVAYGISRHSLLNVKVISTEVFVGILVIILFLNIFSYRNIHELWFNSIVWAFGTAVGVLLVRASLKELRSRSEIETLNLQLQKSIDELQKIDEVKTEFVSLASHQLRTPLTPIKGFADMLKKGEIGGELNEEQKKAADIIYESSQRMVSLIDDLLDVSKLEKEKGFTYNFQVGNPEGIIKNIADELRKEAEAKGITLSFHSQLSPEARVKFDSVKLKDAIENVITNAVKYTLKGNVWVRMSENGEWVVISVKDTGVGIDKDDIPKLFQKFFRGKEVARLSTEGTGLGLYFTRRVIEDHGGHIWAQSEGLEKGSEFIIKLPKAQEQDVPALQPSQAQSLTQNTI